MGIYEMFKDAISMAQKADNIELVKTILNLQEEMFELREKIKCLNEENEKMNEVINEIKTIEFKDDCITSVVLGHIVQGAMMRKRRR